MSNIRFMIVLLILHAIFFSMALYFKKIYNGDSYEYIYMALNIKDHFWFYAGNPTLPVRAEYLTLRTPGYPIFLLLIYIFAVNNWVVLVVQNLFSIFNIYYLRNTIRRIGYTRSYDWIMIALAALYPSQFINANTIAPDIILQTCVLAYFRHFVLMMRYKKWKHAWFMTLGLVAGLSVKPVLYPFVYCHLIIMLIAGTYIKGKRIVPVISGIIPLVCVWLYMLWNYQRTDKLHFTSTQSFNAIYYYYYYYTDKYGRNKADAFLAEERSKIAAMPEYKDRYNYANERGAQLLTRNFLPYTIYHLRQSVKLFFDPGKGELDMFTGELTIGELYSGKSEGLIQTYKQKGLKGLGKYVNEHPSFPIAMVILMFNIVKFFGLILFFISSKINHRIRVFTFFLFCYFALITGPIAHPRYFIPISLIAAGCSVMGYQLSLQQLKNKAIIARYNG